MQQVLSPIYAVQVILGKEKSLLFLCFLYVQHVIRNQVKVRKLWSLNKTDIIQVLKVHANNNLNYNLSDSSSALILNRAKYRLLKRIYNQTDFKWALVHIVLRENPYDANKSYTRIVSVHSCDDNADFLDLDAAILSTEAVSSVSTLNSTCDTVYDVNIYPIRPIAIQTASSACVSLVHHYQNITSTNVINRLLHSYFSAAKLLYVGDTFEIPLEIYAPELLLSANSVYNGRRYFFKCQHLTTGTNRGKMAYGLVVKGVTELRMGVNVQAFLPIDTHMLRNRIIRTCPNGLHAYLAQMLHSVKPFVSRSRESIGSGALVTDLHPLFLVKGAPGSGKRLLLTCLRSYLGMNSIFVDSIELLSSTVAQTESKLKNLCIKLKFMSPCMVVLDKIEILFKEKDGKCDTRMLQSFIAEMTSLLSNNSYPIVVVGVSNVVNGLHAHVERVFLQVFSVNAPEWPSNGSHFDWLCQKYRVPYDNSVNLALIAQKTKTFLYNDLKYVINQAHRMANTNEKSHVDMLTFETVIDGLRKTQSSNFGAPDIVKVNWEDIGGLEEIKEEIIRTINVPLRHACIFPHTNLRRSGLLLYGPPGTGKTLIAKAVATECQLNFISVKGPELLNMYVGQSESNVRDVFTRAREAAPCVIFFDELDSLAPNRGVTGDSGGVMDRLVSQILAEMDGLNKSAFIFVIGATNRPDLIDPALLRPGRFDKLLYVGVTSDLTYKTNVFKALTRKLSLDNDFITNICKCLPTYVTGADMQSIVSQAWLCSVRRQVKEDEEEKRNEEGSGTGTMEVKAMLQSNAKDQYSNLRVTIDDFVEVLRHFKPSVSMEDMKYYETLRNKVSSRKL